MSRIPVPAPRPPGSRGSPTGEFKYLAITPAMVVILLIGLFPLVYTLVVSFQNINMLEEDTSFSGLLNYSRLLQDARFWQALLHTVMFTAIALPIELVLGLLLAYLFLERMPGRQVFVALLVLPMVISPIIAGATWRLLFDNRFGPINQIIGWIAGEPSPILWTVNPSFVYPAILIAESLAVDAVHVPVAAGGLCQRRPVALEAAEIDGAGFLAHLPQDRAARDLAGDGDRDPDPRAGPVPPVRRRLGADQGRARHHAPRPSRSTPTSRASSSSRPATPRRSPS